VINMNPHAVRFNKKNDSGKTQKINPNFTTLEHFHKCVTFLKCAEDLHALLIIKSSEITKRISTNDVKKLANGQTSDAVMHNKIKYSVHEKLKKQVLSYSICLRVCKRTLLF
jgi:hypothetical protein